MNLLKQLVLARMLPQPLSARPDASSAWSKSQNKVKGRGELDHPKLVGADLEPLLNKYKNRNLFLLHLSN